MARTVSGDGTPEAAASQASRRVCASSTTLSAGSRSPTPSGSDSSPAKAKSPSVQHMRSNTASKVCSVAASRSSSGSTAFESSSARPMPTWSLTARWTADRSASSSTVPLPTSLRASVCWRSSAEAPQTAPSSK